MPLLTWFDTEEVDEFAKAIADDLSGRIPAPTDDRQKQITPDRVRNAHDAIIARANAFARVQRLNWYKKASLGNTFKWALLERGYDQLFVDTWTQNLLVAVSGRKGAAN